MGKRMEVRMEMPPNQFHARNATTTAMSKLLKFFALLILLGSCSVPEQRSWLRYIDNTGTYSSPRMADLNNDGTLDIIIGAGGKEEVHSDTAVIALDGSNGQTLWSIPGENQY